jgi:ATP-dependent DNA helicase DinG
VVNVDQLRHPDGGKTKKIELKPVDVDDFLKNFVWSRGRYRVISSATIPYRDNIDEWADRLGLDGDVALISRPMPFPEENRLIHTSSMVGSMSGDDEDRNWRACMDKLREIHSHHEGEKGLVHTNSYARAERVQDSLGEADVMVQPRDKETEEVIKLWQEAEQDILVSPTMVEGVDLYEDRCRWQVLLKTPYPYVGDSRVSYLLNERKDWTWYMESASMDIQQSVGRAVRGPEDSEASSYYVLDTGFDKVIKQRTNPPGWFMEAITDEQPEHWENESAAPWRQQVGE